jgi:hypothetical protein
MEMVHKRRDQKVVSRTTILTSKSQINMSNLTAMTGTDALKEPLPNLKSATEEPPIMPSTQSTSSDSWRYSLTSRLKWLIHFRPRPRAHRLLI